jgi:hypothetical protein
MPGPGVIETLAVRVREQSPKRSSFAVSIRPDDEKSGFGKALALQPSLAAARAIRCEGLFGNNALKFIRRTGVKEHGTVTDELLAELNAALLILSDQLLQD